MNNQKNIEDKFDELWESEVTGQEPIPSKKIYRTLQDRIDASGDGFVPSKPSSYWWWIIGTILIIGLGWGWWYSHKKSDIKPAEPVEKMLIAKADTKPEKIVLDDNSTVSLFKKGVLKYPSIFSSEERFVELLEGKAFFEVHKDIERPFKVSAGDILITVLGTSFEVERKNRETKIHVETGKVMIENVQKNKGITVIAQEAFVYNPSKNYFKKIEKEQHASKQKSMEKTIITVQFENETLQQVVSKLIHQSGFQIELDANVDNGILFSKEYNNQPLLSILEDLSKIYQLDIHRFNKKIRLKHKNY